MRNKKGSVTLPTIMIGGILLLLGYLFMVEIPLKMILQNELINTVDNATTAAVTMIDESAVATGETVILEDQAELVIYSIIADTYDLELIPNPSPAPGKPRYSFTNESIESSKLASAPKVDVKFVHLEEWQKKNGNTGIVTWHTGENGETTEYREEFKHDTVAVRVEVEFDRLVLAFAPQLKLTRFGASQVRIQEYEVITE